MSLAIATQALSALVELVLPAACVVCGLNGSLWCLSCRPAPAVRVRDIDGLAVVSAADYGGAVRTALLAFKERGVRALAAHLAELGEAAIRGLPAEGHAAGNAVIVPIPSRAAAARERGGDHVMRLLRAGAASAPVVPALNLRRSVRDSAGLDIAARSRNLSHGMRARPVPDSLRGRPVVLFDDIVTTGATVREGARALREQGWSVHGAATIAATPLRNAARLSESTAVLQDSSGNRLERLAKEG